MIQQRADDFNELVLVDRAAAQFKVDEYVVSDRRRTVQRFDKGRSWVNN